MPYFNKEQRMHFARIAIGDEALKHPELFEPLRKDDENILFTFDKDIPIKTPLFFDNEQENRITAAAQPEDETQIQSKSGASEIDVSSSSVEYERKNTPKTFDAKWAKPKVVLNNIK